jgi:hypothetical protein
MSDLIDKRTHLKEKRTGVSNISELAYAEKLMTILLDKSNSFRDHPKPLSLRQFGYL